VAYGDCFTTKITLFVTKDLVCRFIVVLILKKTLKIVKELESL